MDICATACDNAIRFALKGCMSFRDKDAFVAVLEAVNQRSGHTVTVDLSELEQVDSFGIGLFLLANEQALAAGNRFNLVNAKGAVARVFDLANLEAILSVKPSESVRSPLRPTTPARRQGVDFRRLDNAEDGSPCVRLSGRLVFAEHNHFQEIVEILVAAGGPRVVLDLGELEFMDSAGLSMIMIAREETEERGQKLTLRNPQGAVAQLLSLSALEFMLEG